MRRVQRLWSEKYHSAPPVVMLSTPADHTTSVTIPFRVVKAKGVLKRDTFSVNSLSPVPWTFISLLRLFSPQSYPLMEDDPQLIDSTTLFQRWKAPETRSNNITTPDTHNSFDIPDDPLILTHIGAAEISDEGLRRWRFLGPDKKPVYTAQSPLGLKCHSIYSKAGDRGDIIAALVGNDSNSSVLIYFGDSWNGVHQDRVFLLNPDFQGGQKYEQIVLHHGFRRLTGNRQSLGNRF